jgi:hypothetical protein
MTDQISLYTRINGKRVGTGKWSFNKIQSYCEQTGITLKSAQHIEYSHRDGIITSTLHCDTGKVVEIKKTGT